MTEYLCHRQPDLVDHEAQVLDTRPGAVALDRSALHPGGGGQVADTGWIEWRSGVLAVRGVQVTDGVWWHLVDGEPALSGAEVVRLRVDGARRARVSRLHTLAHILNALVFERFAGALVSGAQIDDDGTARVDFDLPDAANDALRAMGAAMNDVVRRGLDVRAVYVDEATASSTPGLVRSLSVAPPPSPDGRLRVVEIEGLDRQACCGTHVTNTAACGFVRVTKVENKGKRNRRVRFALDEA